ncbi:MAG TPA: PKD domain-containing protein [Bacteroidales bacterium]|nr:PKD domain-containing protein [Bacteroidales bacterium]
MRYLFTLSVFCILFIFQSRAQNVSPGISDYSSYPYWIEMMSDASVNFYDVQEAFNTYYEGKDLTKLKGWKPFKRWEYSMLQGRIFPDGTRRPEDHIVKAYESYLATHPGARSQAGDWTNLGPFVLPDGKGYKGLGRLNAIAFDPEDPDIVWVGSPSGGLWKTTTHGGEWTSSTQELPSLGVSAILIDPTNPDVMYIGTGDRDAGDAYGIGVYRSTDGGDTWEPWNLGMTNYVVGRLLMHPSNHMIIFAATSGGLFRTTNGGATWTRVQTGDFKDVVFKPNNPDIVYAAANGNFYRSSNNGLNWTQITSGLPGSSRSAIAVTPDNPNYVYVILTYGDSFMGLYRSTDAGLNFTMMSNSPNIMSWGCNGGDGGQAWYDLDIACDPNDADVIFAGGVNCFKSVTGGSIWSISSHWWGDCGVPSVHADLHVLEYNPLNDRLYAGNDGGVYYTDDQGETWTEITNGLPIGQVYKIGQSATMRDKTVNGYQDNGTSTYMGNYWQFILGGDGMECAVDPYDASYSYATVYFGYIARYYNNNSNGTVAENGFNGINESGAWVTPFILDEKNSNIMFVGYKNIWRSTNIKAPSSQIAWQKISSNLGGSDSDDMRVIEQSPVNTDILYAARYDNELFRSDNCKAATPNWFTLTNLLPQSGGIYDIECDPFDENIVYLSQNNKIYKSIDKGQTWEDISGTLPGIAFTSIAAYRNSHGGLYISSDIGVFYKDDFMTDWIMFSDGLPADASLNEIEIYYDADPALDILRAGSYGRGLWESDVYHAAPDANFEARETTVPPGCEVDFNDLSSGIPTEWLWEFEGATPSTSTERNPVGIIYENPGSYQVKLTVSNEAGTDEIIYTDYINVSDTVMPLVDFIADRTSICTNGTVHFTDLSAYCPGTWQWSFSPVSVEYREGTDEFSRNPVVEFRESGPYDVTLSVTNNNGESVLTRPGYIQSGGYNLPFVETFESGTLEERYWTVLNPDFDYTWTDYLIEETGNHTVRMKNYAYFNMGERDQLISPYFNFSELSNVYLTFDHAYAQRFTLRDSLIIYISGECEGAWTRVWANGPDGNGIFETAPATPYEFVPLQNDDWCGLGWGADCFTIDLSDWAGENNVRIIFEGYNNLGNNLFLDNITVSNTTGHQDIKPAIGSFTLFPNPGNGIFTLRSSGITGIIQLDILNSQGQMVLSESIVNHSNTYEETLDLTSLAKGIYIVRLAGSTGLQVKKLIIR